MVIDQPLTDAKPIHRRLLGYFGNAPKHFRSTYHLFPTTLLDISCRLHKSMRGLYAGCLRYETLYTYQLRSTLDGVNPLEWRDPWRMLSRMPVCARDLLRARESVFGSLDVSANLRRQQHFFLWMRHNETRAWRISLMSLFNTPLSCLEAVCAELRSCPSVLPVCVWIPLVQRLPSTYNTDLSHTLAEVIRLQMEQCLGKR